MTRKQLLERKAELEARIARMESSPMRDDSDLLVLRQSLSNIEAMLDVTP